MKRDSLIILILLALVGVGAFVWVQSNSDVTPEPVVTDAVNTENEINSFEECVAAGYPVMESYPEQCAVPGGATFTREIDPIEVDGSVSE